MISSKSLYKVLIISDSLGMGGAERQLALLVKYLPDEWECRVWSMDGGPFDDEIGRSGMPNYYRSTPTRIASHFGDAIISNSQAGLANWGIKPSKGVVIYNGFDWQR